MPALSDLIQSAKPISTGATAVYPYSPTLERGMKFESRFGEEVLLSRVDLENKLIHVPRALCPVGLKDERVFGEPVEFPKDPAPRPHQEKLFKETEDFLLQGLSGVVSAYTG